MKLLNQYTQAFIIVAALLLFVPFLGAVHLFDWDEINFAECAREMLSSGNYLSLQMNYQPFWEKPPLFIWMSALSMKEFGVNEFAARFPNALCGVITLVLIYRIGKKVFDKQMGLLWVLCYAGSTLPQFYFKSGIIDPWFNLFIFSSVYALVLYSYEKDRKLASLPLLLLSALLLALAVLTKGPVAVILVLLCVSVYTLIHRFKQVMSISHFFLYTLVVAFTGGIWFLFLWVSGKEEIIQHFVSYQIHLFQTEDAGHGGPFYYHVLVLLLGCFPASIFALRAFKPREADTPFQQHVKLWFVILFWVVLILFSVVQTKIIHYSSLCYFPLTFLAAYTLHALLKGSLVWKRWMGAALLLTGGLFGLALTLLPLVDRYKQNLISGGWIGDDFTKANLEAPVFWSGFESLIGLLSLGTLLYALWLFKREQMSKAIVVLFGGNLLAVHLATVVVVPKIEQYSQRAAIEFYESLQTRDCYCEALNYKSYAQYFYTLKQPAKNPESYSADWLLWGPIDKTAYFISKVTLTEENTRNYPHLKETGRKNGFVFYLREPEKPPQKP